MALTRYVAAALLTRLADAGAQVALVLLAAADRSPRSAGLLVAALLLPHVLAAPVVGALLDRSHHPRLVVAGAAVVVGGALVAVPVVAAHAPLALTAAVLVPAGCCGPALTGGLSSRLADVVGEARLARGYGVDSLSYNAAGIVGPALAGAVAATAGPAAALRGLGGAAVVGALLVATLPRGGEPAPRLAPDRSRGLRARPPGVAALLRDRPLVAVTLATSAAQLGLGGLPVVAAAVAADRGHPADTGLLVSALAAGGLVGSAAWTARPAAAHRAPAVVLASLAGSGAALVVAALVPGLGGALALLAASGSFVGPMTGALFTTRRARAPRALQARVFTLSAGLKTSAAAGGAALAAATGGAPADAQLLLAAAWPLAAAGLGAAWARRA